MICVWLFVMIFKSNKFDNTGRLYDDTNQKLIRNRCVQQSLAQMSLLSSILGRLSFVLPAKPTAQESDLFIACTISF